LRRCERHVSLTDARQVVPVDAGACNHNIIDDAEAAFTANPFSMGVSDVTVSKDGGFVHGDASAMELLGVGHVGGFEEVPCGLADDFVGGVAENIDDGVRRIQYNGFLGEVCIVMSRDMARLSVSIGWLLPWMVMKVVSIVVWYGYQSSQVSLKAHRE
jgi:hypothetical protein